MPRAGETISFSNLTEDGEKWVWTFGDGSSATSRNPSKIYKKAGTYVVSLMVDSVKWKTIAKEIVVYDTIPTFAATSDSIHYMQEETFKALVYNPYSYNLSYQWIMPQSAVVTSTSLTEKTLSCYFTKSEVEEEISLIVSLDGKIDTITQVFRIFDTPASSLLLKQQAGSTYNMWRQRMYEVGLETPNSLTNIAAQNILNAAQDTVCMFNGKTFKASELPQIGNVTPKGLAIDPVARKIYARGDEGLAVCNIDFSNAVNLSDKAVSALCINNAQNRLFYAMPQSVGMLKLIQTANNICPLDTVTINNLGGIVSLAFDSTER